MKLKKRPLSKCIIKSPYGYRIHPVYKIPKLHTGVDLAATMGEYIYAAADGKILISKRQGDGKGLGEYIVIDHGGWMTVYGHMSIRFAQAGQYVKAGVHIGNVGSTGDSTGPHLHFAICINFLAVVKGWKDPAPFLEEVRALNKEEVTQVVKDILAGVDTQPSDWAKPSLIEAKAAGISEGTRPGGYATREQVITMIMKARKE